MVSLSIYAIYTLNIATLNSCISFQRLKAALSNQGTGTQDGAGGSAGSSIPAVPQRPEQSQQPSQNSDAPSPAQPQVAHKGSAAVIRSLENIMEPAKKQSLFHIFFLSFLQWLIFSCHWLNSFTH